MKNIHTLRLKDIENISSKIPDYSIIMKEILGYKNYYFFKKYKFNKYFKKAYILVEEARSVNPKLVEKEKACKINVPSNIDNITFRAMMELKSIFGTYVEEQDFGTFICSIIAIVCYSENYKKDYDSNSSEFKEFKKIISESPIWQMVGIYNWIEKSLKESEELWSNRFNSVYVEDKDYEQAGGERMNQFNVINTIKNICNDFNCTLKQAWQTPYALSQTNSYSKATANHIQDQMRQIKEIKMEMKRKSKKYS